MPTRSHRSRRPRSHGPRLIDLGAEPAGTNWLEIFYDLVYGVTVIQLTDALAEHADARGVLRFLAFLLPTWWVWLGWTVYGSRFEARDVPHRLLTFAQMLAIAAMGVQIQEGRGASTGFAAAYIGARLCLLTLYARSQRHVPSAGAITRVYLYGFGIGVVFWIASMLIPPPTRYSFWTLGLCVDMVTPWVFRPILQRLPLHPEHLAERLGIFASIILTVAIEGVIVGVADVHWELHSVAAALLGFVLAVSIWWIYSVFVETADLGRLGSGQPYIYCHLPLIVGLSFMSAGVRRAIIGAAHGTEERAGPWLLGGGAAIWLASLLLMSALVFRYRDKRFLWYFGAALVGSGVLPLAAPVLSEPVFIGVLAAGFVGLVVVAGRSCRSPDAGADAAHLVSD